MIRSGGTIAIVAILAACGGEVAEVTEWELHVDADHEPVSRCTDGSRYLVSSAVFQNPALCYLCV